METKEILEGNKLIAEFMGLSTISEDVFNQNPEGYNITMHSISEYQRYHSSWDWLMPVVEKIESLNYWSEIFKANDSNSHLCNFWSLEGDESRFICCGKDWSKTKIEATYKAVIEFIKWYNQNK